MMFRLFDRLKPSSHPCTRFSRLSDQEWLAILLRSINEPVIDGIRMPGFPDSAIQTTIVGSAGEQPLREVFNFFTSIRKYTSGLGHPLQPDTRVLDFGCGWGRILRFFLKDCEPSNLVGIDVDPDLVAICKNTMNYGSFHVVDPLPPTQFPDNSFDVIVGYSVFSHLAEHASRRWITEFSRLLRPAGMMFVTTWGREFIELCRSMRRQPQESPWHQELARCFVDTDAAYRAYDAGEYLYEPTGGGSCRPPDFYGETLIPESYARTRWTESLEFVDFVNEPQILPQALIVMRKN